MKNVILRKHSPLYRRAKAIPHLHCCLKQYIFPNQETLNLNENMLDPVTQFSHSFVTFKVVGFMFQRPHSDLLPMNSHQSSHEDLKHLKHNSEILSMYFQDKTALHAVGPLGLDFSLCLLKSTILYKFKI